MYKRMHYLEEQVGGHQIMLILLPIILITGVLNLNTFALYSFEIINTTQTLISLLATDFVMLLGAVLITLHLTSVNRKIFQMIEEKACIENEEEE